MDELEPITIGISDEERRRREEQQRRDDEARAAALRALQQVEPQLQAVERGAPVRPEDVGVAPVEPYRGRVVTPHAQTPGARVMESGAVVLRGEPQTAETLREHQQARQAMSMPARPEAPTSPMDAPAVGSGSDPQMRADAPAQPSPVPQFEQPTGNPMAAAMGAVRGVEGRREADGDLSRWDARIRTVQHLYDQERDARRRAVLGTLLMNLVGGAASALSGARYQPTSPQLARLEERLSRRLGDHTREWDATDRAMLQAAELRQGRQARATQGQDRDAARALQDRSLGLQERRLDMQAATEEERRALARQELERVAAEREQRRLPESALSRSYQDTMRQRIETYRATGQAPLADSLERLFGGRLESMTAEQLEPLLGRTGGLPQVHTRGRAGGTGGTGGSGGVRAPGREGISRQQAAQERIRAATERGMDAATAEQLERDGDLARIVAQDTLTRGPQQRAQEYGERIAMSGLARADQALRAVEDFVRANPGDLPGQGVVDTWGGLRPGWAQSQAGREFQRLTRRLLDSELRQATGANAPESEVQTFRQILGLSETSSDEDVVRALQQAREYVDSEFNALRGSYGPDAIRVWEEQARATRGRGTQAAIAESPTAPQPQSGGQVRIIREGGGAPVTLPADDPRVSRFRDAPGYRVEEVR
jgi:hypothetical protein